jgi:diadenylate cyclase
MMRRNRGTPRWLRRLWQRRENQFVWDSLQAIGPTISAAFQIAVLAFLFYYLFLLFRGTSGEKVLIGLVLLLTGLLVLTQVFNLEALAWVLRRIAVYLAVGLLVIFQPEIRAALAELGRQPVIHPVIDRHTLVDHLVEATHSLADQKVGALIAVEREIGTRAIQETGTVLDAPVVPELLTTIFFPHTPLHDGGVIISRNRIAAAGCLFPLSHRQDLLKTLGTRHRAAIGLTEETDAVAIVVSEETGSISVAYRGRLTGGLDNDRLERILGSLLLSERQAGESWWRGIQRKLYRKAGEPDAHGSAGPPRQTEGSDVA